MQAVIYCTVTSGAHNNLGLLYSRDKVRSRECYGTNPADLKRIVLNVSLTLEKQIVICYNTNILINCYASL